MPLVHSTAWKIHFAVTENVSETFAFGCMKVYLNVTISKRYVNVSHRFV